MSASVPQAPSHLLPAAAVAVCGAMWGIFWMPLHWFASQGVGSAWVSFIFNVLAIATPLPWMLNRRAWAGFASQSINGLLLGAAFSLYTVSLAMTDVINAILLFYLTPVWSTLASWVLFGERLSLRRLLAMLMGFAGLAAVLGTGGGFPMPRNAGDWIALASGMFWAAGTLRSFRHPSRGIALPVFTFAMGGCISSGIILAVTAAMDHPLAGIGQLAAALPWIVVLGLIIFVPPNFLVLWAAQRMDSARIGILLMTEVLFGTISAALFSGEPFGLADAAGAALIVGAGVMEVLRR